MRELVITEVRRLGPPEDGCISKVRPFATGVTVEGQIFATGDGTDLLFDADAVVVERTRRRLTRGAWHVGEAADQAIKPLLDRMLSVFAHCEIVGINWFRSLAQGRR